MSDVSWKLEKKRFVSAKKWIGRTFCSKKENWISFLGGVDGRNNTTFQHFVRAGSELDTPPIGQRPIGQLLIGQLLIGQLSIGQLPIGQLSIGQLSIGQLSIGQLLIDQIDQVSIGQL